MELYQFDVRQLELKQLKCFLAVVQEKHFGRAALKLNMDQAPLSRSIKTLEDCLGAKLFIRNAKSTLLTREGQILLDGVQDIFNIINDVKTKISALQNGYSGLFRIGFNDGIDVTRISKLVKVLRQNNPDVDVQLHEISHNNMQGHLEYDCDVIFSRYKTHDKHLISEQVWIDEIVTILPQGHALAKHVDLSIVQLANYRIFCLNSEKYMGYYEQLKSSLDSIDIDFPYILESVESYTQLVTLVNSGLGVGIVDYAMCNNLRNRQIIIKRLQEKFFVKTYMIYNFSQKIDVFKHIISYARNFD